MRSLFLTACLLSSAPSLSAGDKPGKQEFLTALDWARRPVQQWSDQHVPTLPADGNAFLMVGTMALAPDAWSAFLIHETRVTYVSTELLQPSEQLALLHLAEPKATAEKLMQELVFAQADFTLGRIVRSNGIHGYTLKGPDGMPTDPEVDAFFLAITKAPVPFYPGLEADTVLDGSNIHFEDRWHRTPVFTFDTHGLVESSEREARWGQAGAATDKLDAHLYDLWVAKLRKENFAPILAQIHDIHIQGPIWFRVATGEQWPDLARLLLARGLDPREAGPDGTVPMVSACALNDETLFSSLVAKWGSPVACFHPDQNSWDSPLLAAVRSGHPFRVAQLATMGADPNPPGESPLELAIEMKSSSMVQALLRIGARVSDEALDLAKETGSKPILEALESAHAAQKTGK